MSVFFNGATKIIQLGGGDYSYTAQEIYEAWKEWVLAGNAQYPPAFRSIGGDPLGGGALAGSYFFLNNAEGWRIRPEAVDHNLDISGNLFGEDAGQPIFVPTIGDFQVLIRLNTSSLTQTIQSGSGLSNEQATQLLELWKRLGLDPTAPVTATPNQITAGDIEIALTGDGVTTSTATRQP